MFKKVVAIMLAATMLLQPIAASAVTWNEVKSSLQSTGSYNDGTTSAMLTGNSVAVIGGTVSDVVLDDAFGESVFFIDVVIDGQTFTIRANGQWHDVYFVNETAVNVGSVELDAVNDGEISISVGNDSSITADAINISFSGNNQNDDTPEWGGGLWIDNQGTISVQGSILGGTGEEAVGSIGISNFEDAVLSAGSVDITVGDESSVYLYNGGSVQADESISVKAQKGSTGYADIYNDESGIINAESVKIGLGETHDNWLIIRGDVNADIYASAGGDKYSMVQNEGTVDGRIEISASDEVQLDVVNAGVVTDVIWVDAYDESLVDVYNTDGGKANIDVGAYDSAEVFVGNESELGYANTYAYDNGKVFVSNASYDDGEGNAVTGSIDQLYNISEDEGTIEIWNAGSINELVADIYDDSEIAMTGEGTVETATLYINTPTADTLTPEQIVAILDKIELPEGADVAAELWTISGDEFTARYAIDENGNVTLIEVFTKQAAEESEPSEEMIRHWMEEIRQERAIGGVYGSPYWLKQAYLGYHSIEMRLYANGEKHLFKQDLTWLNDGTDGKRIILRSEVEDPEELMLHIGGKAIETLERAEITTITLMDYNKVPYMEYKVSDLKAAREKYGLAETDMLCVGDGDAEVMKIGADGQMVPVEETAAE